MTQIECGIMAYDVHELLCHFLAQELGYYEEEGLEVFLRDRTFTAAEDFPDLSYFQVACGGAFMARRHGRPFKVVFAAVHRPIFWMYSSPEIETIEQLAGKRIAAYPPFAPPQIFHRLLLRSHGLEPDEDVSFEPVRDDEARLALLRTGEVQAAAVSSAYAPAALEREGLRKLALLGDEVTMVTSGIGTQERMLREQPEELAGLVRSFRRALEDIHGRPDVVVPVMARVLRQPDDVAAAMLDEIRPCFTRDGTLPLDVLQAAVDRVGAAAPGEAGRVDAAELYDFSLLEGAATAA
jgi:ABC-type nitrate/sulfonate/bicarbonate transport system substrate-binding protein